MKRIWSFLKVPRCNQSLRAMIKIKRFLVKYPSLQSIESANIRILLNFSLLTQNTKKIFVVFSLQLMIIIIYTLITQNRQK